jgi:hypothetical protein
MNLRFLLAFSVLLTSVSPVFGAESETGAQAPPQPGVTAQLSAPADRAILKKASEGSRLFVTPVLIPGKVATVSVFDARNQPLANTSLVVNGSAIETNQEGRAHFVVPRAGATIIVLPMYDETKDLKVSYAITNGGAMVIDPSLGKFVDGLLAGAPAHDPAPRILYNPMLIQAGHPISVIGVNFDGQPGNDKVLIDNVECEVLSSSPVSILAMPPTRLSAGPLREMFVTAKGESSPAVEVDLVGITSTIDTVDGAADALFKLDAAGTKMPVLLRYENTAPSAVSLASSEGAQLPPVGWAMTPGGTDETLSLRLNIISSVSSPVTVEVAPDLAIMPDAADDEGVRTLAKNLVEDRIAYLKRLSIAIESQIAAVQKARAELLAASPPAPAEEVEKLTAEASTLSLRQSRLSTSLSGQRAMFMALGGTDEEYRVALDEAVGGAYLLGNKKPGDVFAANSQLEELRRQRRLAEPRMKLLPPENWNGSEFVEVASTSSPAPSDKDSSSANVEPVPPADSTPTTLTPTAPVATPAPPKPVVTPAATKPAEKPKPADKNKPASGKGKTATTKGGGAKKQPEPVRSTRTKRGSKSTRAVRSTRKSSQRAAGRSAVRSTKKTAGGGRRKRNR